MESQVKQLKINARNIESFLSKSNRTLRKHRQDQKKFNIRQTNIQKQKIKEFKIESKGSPVKKSSNVIAGTAKKGVRGIFGMLGNVMDFLSSIVLGNAVTNIENIANWFSKKNITFQSVFGRISDFATMIADQGTKLLAMAVKLPEEFPELSEENSTNTVEPLTTSNVNNKIDKNSWGERMFPSSEMSDAQEGSDIINRMFGHQTENNENSQVFDFSNSFNLNDGSDASKLITNFNFDPNLLEGLYNTDLNEESVDHLVFMTQKILIE